MTIASDIKNIKKIYTKNNNNELKEITKGCVIINGQIKYFYGIKKEYIAPGYIKLPHIINNKNIYGYNDTYIDTGVKMANNIRVEFRAQATRNLDASTVNNEHPIMYISEKCYLSFFYRGDVIKKMKIHSMVGYAEESYFLLKNVNINFDFNTTNDHSYNFYVGTEGDIITVSGYNWNAALDSSNNAGNIYLLGAPYSSTIFTPQYPNTKLYYCKIYQDNRIIKDFVPVEEESSGRLGLYDTINNDFFPNTSGSNLNFILNDSGDDPYPNLDYNNCPANCFTCDCDGKITCDCDTETHPPSCPTNTNDCPTDTDDCPTDTDDCPTKTTGETPYITNCNGKWYYNSTSDISESGSIAGSWSGSDTMRLTGTYQRPEGQYYQGDGGPWFWQGNVSVIYR